MISDESSSDSETGRFKGRTESRREKITDHEKDLKFNARAPGRGRPSDNDRFNRDFDKRRDDRNRFEMRPKERQSNRTSRFSPVRRRSREKSRDRSRRSRDRFRSAKEPAIKPKSPPRSRSHGRRISPPCSHKSPPKKKDYRDEERPGKFDRGKSRDKGSSSSPEHKVKKSVVQKPVQGAPKPKPESPIQIVDHESEDEVQPGSYYSMIPAVIKEKEMSVEQETIKEKEKTEESSEIDSSDDERLRAKLLNIEKELNKTRKKKHRKKHRKKSSKSKDKESDVSVEVSSTTDIGKEAKGADRDKVDVEVSSTQKAKKDSSEEGEISSDDQSKESVAIDASDLRHRLKRPPASEPSGSPDLRDRLKAKPDAGVCGPALPPHLEKRFRKSVSPGVEGSSLPPNLGRKDKHIGPSIPQEMRKVLAEAEVEPIKCDSTDEEDGIGPLPAGAETKWKDAHKRLEERALDIKIKKMEGHKQQSSDVKSREKWMLELPEGKAKIMGLEARSFRAKEGPDMSDRSSWTDTPEEKARKAAGGAGGGGGGSGGGGSEDPAEARAQDARARLVAARDDQQEKAARKHKKKHKRDESLLDIHQKKLKKKKKKDEKEDGKKERRPFSRDHDLQANRFDEAQKKSIIKKAQELDTRFGRGEAKYL